jgi:multimeric flavodoxin WrbA
MKILGLSASRRSWGNTDILVQRVLYGAELEGAVTTFLRLTDFDLSQCQGCLSCLLKERDCMLPDRFSELLDQLRQADALVLGSPVYNLFAAGSVQMLLPRLFRQARTGELAGKPGVALAVGGRPGWEGWALYQTALFLLTLGLPVVDQFIGYGQGPGEVLFDEAAWERAMLAGRALGRGNFDYRGDPGICPACHFDLVVTEENGRARCLLCDLPGRWASDRGSRRFEPLPGTAPRWGPEESRRHFENLILPSGRRFLSRKEEIGIRLKKFQKEILTFKETMKQGRND